MVKPVRHCFDQGIQARKHPFIHNILWFQLIFGGIEPVNIRIEDIERVGIPQRTHKFALHFADRIVIKTRGQPRRARRIEIPPHRVRALLVKNAPRIDDISFMLAHFLSVLILHMPKHDAVFKGRFIKNQRTDGKQRIEPSARLVHSLADKVRRKMAFKFFLMFKGIMPLRKGHAPAVIPAVDHFRYAVHTAAAGWTLKRDGIKERLVQLDILAHLLLRHFAQLGTRAYYMDLPAITHPNRQRRSPITLTGNAPVDHVFQEVAHTPVADVFRQPVDAGIVFQEIIPKLRHFDKPCGARVIDERRITAPAERIAVLVWQFRK